MALHYVEHGAGTPVVGLHGWASDHRLMLGLLEPLFARRGGYRRIYPDLPGMGASPAGGAASSDDMLAAVDAFVDELLGGEPFLLVGQSHGALVARGLARARPGQILGLALVCPVASRIGQERRARPEHVVLRPDPELIAGLDQRTADAYADSAVVQDETTLRRFRDEVLVGVEVADVPALTRIAERWDLREDPEGGAAYPRPTLIVTGRQDSSVGYADQYALLDHYPRASYAVLDVAGHCAHLEQPVLIEALLTDWLDRVAAETPPR
jgi:pimeloyl-ACP methyl ester carboxylesterase